MTTDQIITILAAAILVIAAAFVVAYLTRGRPEVRAWFGGGLVALALGWLVMRPRRGTPPPDQPGEKDDDTPTHKDPTAPITDDLEDRQVRIDSFDRERLRDALRRYDERARRDEEDAGM